MFTTAKALENLFEKIQIYPSKGKNGEILFAPISRLSPGLIKDKTEGSQALLDRTKFRNQQCMDIAYFYVRIFQIYAALALTVLDTDPTRRRSARGYKPLVRGAQHALFMGQRGQSGGAGLAQRNPMRSQMKNTPFEPLSNYFTQSGEYLKMEDKTKDVGEFLIQWVAPRSTRPEISMTLRAFYRKNGIPVEASVTMTKTSSSEIEMTINSEKIQTFQFAFNTWQFKYDDYTDPTKAEPFFENIHDFFNSFDFNVKRPGAFAPAPARAFAPAPAGAAATGIGIPTGRSTFEGFDQLKKLYEDRLSGKEFPKAYCIARAMILLMPIFDSERLDKNQKFYSQICKKEYDFETIADAMPRPGRRPNANIYLKSLVSLYYDDYQFKGTEVSFTQTESGRSELREASKKLAGLYDIKSDPERFVESSTEFKPFPGCAKTPNALLELRDDNFRREIQNTIIRPMLNLQESHTAKVNALLKKMFDVKVDKSGNSSMSFTKALRGGGREAVNNFGREAHDLLLDYYLKSEAWFIKGVLLIESKPNLTISVL